MATLKKRRSKWYARIRIWANDIRKETKKTGSTQDQIKVVALERLSCK